MERSAEKLRIITNGAASMKAFYSVSILYDNICVPAARDGKRSVRLEGVPLIEQIGEWFKIGVSCKVHNPDPQECDCHPRENCRLCLPDRYTILSW
jgi:hypothetical protein